MWRDPKRKLQPAAAHTNCWDQMCISINCDKHTWNTVMTTDGELDPTMLPLYLFIALTRHPSLPMFTWTGEVCHVRSGRCSPRFLFLSLPPIPDTQDEVLTQRKTPNRVPSSSTPLCTYPPRLFYPSAWVCFSQGGPIFFLTRHPQLLVVHSMICHFLFSVSLIFFCIFVWSAPEDKNDLHWNNHDLLLFKMPLVFFLRWYYSWPSSWVNFIWLSLMGDMWWAYAFQLLLGLKRRCTHKK